jgi:hypothetical protein
VDELRHEPGRPRGQPRGELGPANEHVPDQSAVHVAGGLRPGLLLVEALPRSVLDDEVLVGVAREKDPAALAIGL